jgi:hypothetical protein
VPEVRVVSLLLDAQLPSACLGDALLLLFFQLLQMPMMLLLPLLLLRPRVLLLLLLMPGLKAVHGVVLLLSLRIGMLRMRYSAIVRTDLW